MRAERQRFARFRPVVRWRRELSQLTVRPATVADASAIARITRENRGGVLGRIEARILEELAEADDLHLLLVATAARRVVGYARAKYHCPDATSPANTCAAGWYLLGIVVTPRFRRAGVARALTRERLRYVRERASEAFYFANEKNLASIALHDGFGFHEISRDFHFPRVTFHGGDGVLFRVELKGSESLDGRQCVRKNSS